MSRVHQPARSADRAGRPLTRSAANRSGRDLVLARAATRPFPRDDLAPFKDLAAPYPPRFPAAEGAGQASKPCRAVDAELLRLLQFGRRLAEPQIGVLHPA